MPDHRYQSDPFALAIADGRLLPRPDEHYATPTVLDIDLELLGDNMRSVLTSIIAFHPRIRNAYSGSSQSNFLAAIKRGVDAMIDAALAVTYNRLRALCERYHPTVVPTRMKHRAPICDRIDFPAFIASTLSKIGPLRIRDAAKDTLVIYATTANRMRSHGRKDAGGYNSGLYDQLACALRSANVRMAPIDFDQPGSFFTTIVPMLAANGEAWTFKGTQHASHYEKEDIVRAFLTLHPDLNLRAVDCIAEVMDECTDEAVVAAIAGARPPGVQPDADPTTSLVEHIGFHYPTMSLAFVPLSQPRPPPPPSLLLCTSSAEGMKQFISPSWLSTFSKKNSMARLVTAFLTLIRNVLCINF